MDKADLDHLPLLTANGDPVNLAEHFEKYGLLIFLRHLA
jgi:hypothetical protein